MLTEDPDSRVYKRIFSKFNTALFGVEPTPGNDFVIDDGDYDSEVENFKKGLRAEDTTNLEIDEFTSPTPSPPTPTVQSDHHVSISVTSHVSHTVAASSQVSNIVTSGPAPPPESEAKEASPPRQKGPRPVAKKKDPKASNPTTTTPQDNTDTAPTRSKKATRSVKTTPVEPSSRVLRNRT